MSIMRRIRGVAGTAITWASGWGLLGAALHAVALAMGWNGLIGVTWVGDILGHAAIGFSGGAVFAAGLLISERGRGIADVRLSASAFWGGLAGLLGAATVLGALGGVGLLPELWPALMAGAALGVGSGAGMSAIARAGDRGLRSGADHAMLGPVEG